MAKRNMKIAGASIAAALVLIIVSMLNVGYGLYVLSQGGEPRPLGFIVGAVGAMLAVVILISGRRNVDEQD